MSAPFKAVGAVGQQLGGTSNSVGVPAVATGDYLVLVMVASVSTITLPAGWTQIGTPLAGSGSWIHTWRRYADADASSTTVTVTHASGLSVGYVVVYTGCDDLTAVSVVSSGTSGAYVQSAPLTSEGPWVSFSAVNGLKTITAGAVSGAGTADGIAIRGQQQVSAAGATIFLGDYEVTDADTGTVRWPYTGSSSTLTRNLLLPLTVVPPEPEWLVLSRVDDAGDETPITNVQLTRVVDGVEQGFYYQSAATGEPWHLTRVIDGDEEGVDLSAVTSLTPWSGLPGAALGDSGGVSQGGADYTSGQLWHQQLATALGTTIVNAHWNSSMAADVFERLNDSGSVQFFTPGVYGLVTIECGGNDIGFGHDDDAGKIGYRNSMAATLGLLMMRSRVLASAGTTGGTWTTAPGNHSGGGRASTASGATLTMSFTGTDAMLLLLADRGGTGTTYSVTVDGGTPITGTTLASAIENPDISGDYAPVPVFLRGLADTSHTVVITRTAGAGATLVVDSLVVLEDDLEEIPFVLCFPPPDIGASGWTNYPSPHATSTDVEEYNALFQEARRMAAPAPKTGAILFDHIARSFYTSSESLTLSDDQHPNLAGHTRIKDIAVAAIPRTLPA